MREESTAERADRPLLTIAIPTYNRAGYLELNLAQLRSELRGIAAGTVEVLVSDNCSPDRTPEVVAAAQRDGLDVRYVRNERNLGWGPNFAQCFDLARGTYVILLGDDDLFIDGALREVLDRISAREYGLVLLGAYGYDDDFRAEYPGRYGEEREYADANAFVADVGAAITLTSACVVNKSLIPDVDSRQQASGDLAFFPIALRAALAGRANLHLKQYLIASKRQNSFNYEFSKVFVNEMWQIYDDHVRHGLRPETVRTIERDLLLHYYPFYLFDLRLGRRSDPAVALANFRRRFGGRWQFEWWLAPTLTLPRPLAVGWGAFTTVVGRVSGGEGRRGVAFAWNRARQSVARRLGRRAGATAQATA